ncbi:hypothetical protein D3C77_446930 [compost metagenome]
MATTVGRLQQAGEQLQKLSVDAQASQADPADVVAQLNLLKHDLEQLKASVLLLSAPQGIALTSGKHLQLAAQDNVMLNAGGQADFSVVKRLFIGVGQGLSLFVRKLGIKLIANQGAVKIQAQNDSLQLLARHGLEICSTEDEIHIVAKKKITLNAGGSYITLDQCSIESGTGGEYNVKSAYYTYSGAATMTAAHPDFPKLDSSQTLRMKIEHAPNVANASWIGMPYKLFANGAQVAEGVLDASSEIRVEHQLITSQYQLRLANGVSYQLPIPGDYRNPEQAHLANDGLQHHNTSPDARIKQPVAHTDHRHLYAALLGRPSTQEETAP